MVELVVIAALAYAGVLAAGFSGATRVAPRLALALPLGVAVYVPALLVPLVVGIPVAPQVALAVVVVGLSVAAIVRAPTLLGWALAGAALHGAVTVVMYRLTFARVTPDSFSYLEAAGILRDFRSLDALTAPLALTRQYTYPAVQALAAPGGYLRTFSLLALLAAVAVVVVAANQTLGAVAPSPALQALVLLATLAPNRVAFHALYLNGHTLFAALFAVIGAAGWIAWKRPDAARTWWGPATLATIALVPLRPEAVLVAGMAMLPLVFAPGVPVTWRRAPVVALGATTVLWYAGGPLRVGLVEGRDPDPSVLLAIALGVAALVAVTIRPLLALSWTTVRRLVAGGLGATLLLLTVRRPDEVLASLQATGQNLTGDGNWGWFWPAMVVLLVVAWRSRPEAWGVLIWPLATFPALGLLLALVRGIPYRVGPGDSFSRMLVHLVPLLALTLIARLEQPAVTLGDVDSFSAQRRAADGGGIGHTVSTERSSPALTRPSRANAASRRA
jgi:hypothetical protein